MATISITIPADDTMSADLRAALEKWATTMNEMAQMIETLAGIAAEAEAYMEGAGQPEFGNYARIANAARAGLRTKKKRKIKNPCPVCGAQLKVCKRTERTPHWRCDNMAVEHPDGRAWTPAALRLLADEDMGTD